MLVEIKHKAIRINSRVQVQQEDHTGGLERQRREELARQMRLEHQDAAAGIAEEVTGITEVVDEPVANHEPVVREGCKIGRNEPCPCGSGKKYKQCCGKFNSFSFCHKLSRSAETDEAIQACYSGSVWIRGFSFFSQIIAK